MQNFRGLTRRDFLKLVSLVPLGVYSRPLVKLSHQVQNSNSKNVIILVFDAWSQRHVSLYGYARPTMPNLETFARNATVYHNHYAAGTFTTPGTASILSGLYPWSHRAFQLGAGLQSPHAGHTLFSALSATHSTLAFSQNKFADQLLYQDARNIDRHIQNWSFNVQETDLYDTSALKKNPRVSFAFLEDNVVQKGEGIDTSLFLGPLYRLYTLRERSQKTNKYMENYPRGLPDATEYFLLPDVVDGVIDFFRGIQQPALTYIHFYPPHEPYTPTTAFFDRFKDDGLLPVDKPFHDVSATKYSYQQLALEERYYDEYIAAWDHEVARLFQFLEESGLTESSYIFITSDHGDLFERGELGHWTKMIYDSLIHVPLIVRQPGQRAREDVHTVTSNVDLLPTIAQLTGNPIPDWTEGKLLPKLGGEAEGSRSVFSMDAKMNSSFGPLRNFSMSITRDQHRLVHYSYPKDHYEKYEFYDLDSDHDELKDLYPSQPALARQMQDELSQKLLEVNKPFPRNGF